MRPVRPFLPLALACLLSLFLSSITSANQRVQGWCEQGKQPVVLPGAYPQSTTQVQRSYPKCTVTVYITGSGGTLATLYSDNSGTPLANPFTADSFGHWFYYTGDGYNDVQLSGAGLSSPYTFGSVNVIDAYVLQNGTGSQPRLKVNKLNEIVSVKDYGAKGDGITDDTVAIQAAFTYANSQIKTIKPGNLTTSTLLEVYFPIGRYVVSDTLTILGGKIRCGGNCTVEQSTPAKGILFVSGKIRFEISGITFIGGAYGIHFENANLDVTTVDIANCEFLNILGPALEFLPTAPANHLSALIDVHDSKFYDPRTVLNTTADYVHFKNNWVSWHYWGDGTGALDNTAAFTISSSATLEMTEFVGVPGPDPINAPNMRWIDNYNVFIGYKCRFGGEGGGLPVVWNYSGHGNTSPFYGGNITLRDSFVSPGNNFNSINKSGVVIFKTDIPGVLLIENVQGLVTPIIRDETGTLSTIINATPHPAFTYWYRIRGITAAMGFAFPPELYPLLQLGSEYRPPWNNVAATPTTSGWQLGQQVQYATPTYLGPSQILNMVDASAGASPVWASTGLLSPLSFSGRTDGTFVSAGVASVTFTIPATTRLSSFVGLLTLSSDVNPLGSALYRNSSTYVIGISTGLESGVVTQRLFSAATPLLAMGATGTIDALTPTITSIVFGSTGLVTRQMTFGGTIIITWDHASATSGPYNIATLQLISYINN